MNATNQFKIFVVNQDTYGQLVDKGTNREQPLYCACALLVPV